MEGAKRFALRLDPVRGADFVDLAGATIRNIARGVIGTSLLQAFLAGLILALFGVPTPGAIAFGVLVFCALGVGPLPVLVPVIIWVWLSIGPGTALFMAALFAPLVVIDQILRPLMMARGLATPMLVVIIGVIGGTVSYGLIGLFLGPVILGVSYELFTAWLRAGPDAAPPPSEA